ncbi:ExbD/TolR family protein [Hoeflea poritis]|uniref:Biopolymer transporter ExbD n=1 Tax=Hoeflea poritis TaxID=2993659 RepID=A0ABT4VMU2_9HYPH|nr:biopolymer transporter ExbD [Hoeflea poritis]MDA4846036.1 biopolymer transporter ExbD [Hoeflea poritis]
MRRLPRPAPKPRGENTIALINIVFLMLIFFLIAGTLAPPMDGDVELIRAADARSVEPPRALFVTEQGVLKYEGEEVTPQAYLDKKRSENTGTQQPVTDIAADTPVGPEVKLAADGRLPATRLIEVIDELKTAGAGKIAVITERKAK